MLKLNAGMWPSAAAAVLTDVSVHHLGTEFAHSLQVVDLPLQERYLGFQVLILGLVLKVWDKMRRWEKQTCQQPKGERGRERGGENNSPSLSSPWSYCGSESEWCWRKTPSWWRRMAEMKCWHHSLWRGEVAGRRWTEPAHLRGFLCWERSWPSWSFGLRRGDKEGEAEDRRQNINTQRTCTMDSWKYKYICTHISSRKEEEQCYKCLSKQIRKRFFKYLNQRVEFK